MPEMGVFPTLESALNVKFRGHGDRDWVEWREKYVYGDAAEIPADTANAWIDRQKLNYRGIGKRRTLRHLISANVDQPLLNEIGDLEMNRAGSAGGVWL